ncbi:hypothetical protein CH263_06175 [Rhodococcus sp. 06-1059B-a]|nr:hypothetical protein [Rhodococcus sp. 06-1059B-a]OZD70507.1 hypothetical protein CH263_06175 [Rhodococcus sp. 06-1059B-a]
MTTHEIPLLTVPASDVAAAILADWLVRSLVPIVLDGAGMAVDADGLCALAPITARRIGGRRRLRVHERRLDLVIAALEERLQRPSASPPAVAAAVVENIPIGSLPDEVLDAAAHIGGTIADLGSPAAALANRALYLGALVVDTGFGATTSEDLRIRVVESYCSLLTYLWTTDPDTQIHLTSSR